MCYNENKITGFEDKMGQKDLKSNLDFVNKNKKN